MTRSRPQPPIDATRRRERWPTPRLGRYELRGVLGSGGMGIVYEGYDELLGRRVAIKQLARGNGRLLREAQALARLASPNVVAVYEVIESDAQVFIVMELVEGWTLHTWIDERKPSRAELLAALVQAGHGVAAAHAVGIVHRDLKPQNIMVGNDGRVRVMDFGLARAIDMTDPDMSRESAEIAPSSSLDTPLTAAGALIGTPGYMAPEQCRGQPADERSDVYGFCVVAFEALHGCRLFDGASVERVEATLRGRIDAPLASEVPAWLDATIRRGLANDPDARWPTMTALLDALARDPLARRRRRLRGVVVVVVVVVVTIALGLAYVELTNRRAEAEAEALARRRLDAVERAIAEAEAKGDQSAAEAAFDAFVSDPAHQGTRALSLAWRRRGDRRHDRAAAQADYAQAYILAQTPEDTSAALHRIADVFHERWDGRGLARAVELLRGHAVAERELAERSFDAAVWERDLPGAIAAAQRLEGQRAAWQPTLEHIAHAHTTGLEFGELGVLPLGRAARIVVLGEDFRELVLLDETLHELERRRLDGHAHLVDGSSWVLTWHGDEMRLLDLFAPGELRWPVPRYVFGSVRFDLTGDARPELLFSYPSPYYGLRAIEFAGGQQTRDWIAHPGTDATKSTLESSVVADLDGDGVLELATAIGAWHGFDLRIFHAGQAGRAGPNRQLELLARERIGRITALATVRRGDQLLLAAITDESNPAPEVFPEPPHTGSPAGVHLFRWTGARLEEVEFVPLPRDGGAARFRTLAERGVGDFDGDGREDLAFGLLDAHERHWLLLLRQTGEGFDPLYLGRTKLQAVAQLDADAAHELLVVTDPQPGLVALGLGFEPTARALEPAEPSQPPPVALDDPLLVERWQRAEDLVALGLRRSAAASLRRAAPLAASARARLDLLDRAAQLYFAEGGYEEALALDRYVRADPELAPLALARSVEALVKLGRYEEALVDAQALLAAPGPSPEQGELARALWDELGALVESDARVDLSFDAPLAPSWSIAMPGALRRDPTRSLLELTIPARVEPVAELPIEWDGGPISLEFELELERIEYGACVRLTIVDEAGATWLGGGLCTRGGGGELFHHVGMMTANGWDNLQAVPLTQLPRQLQIRITYLPERGRGEFVLDDGEQIVRRSFGVREPTAGRQRLSIGSINAEDEAPNLAVARLRRITVRGARLATVERELVARDAPARLLAERRALEALDALAGAAVHHPRAELLRLLAHAELRDLAGLREAAADVCAQLGDPAWRAELSLVLRTNPLAAAALISVAGSAILPALRDAWSLMGPHRSDPAMHRLVLDDLHGFESLPPTTLAEHVALRELLSRRGSVWRHAGERERARRDLETAAALLGTDERDDRERHAETHLELAQLLAETDPKRAAWHIAQAMYRAPFPDELRERVGANARLAALSGW